VEAALVTTVFTTGIGGFVGHHFFEHILENTGWDVIGTDSFRHKGRTDRVSQVLDNAPDDSWRSRVDIITHDLNAPFSVGQAAALSGVDYMVCFASNSHVDRSITDPVPFVRGNVEVALNTLELARRIKPGAVVWVSTDEVYGPVEESDAAGHEEWSAILPSNPYSGSKAAQEAIAISYWRTYGVPLVIVNCMNLVGERQDPEKFVPMVIGKLLAGEKITIHGTASHIGTRHYLHSRNLADGILHLLSLREPACFPAHAARRSQFAADRPDRYNVSSPDRIDNLALARMIAEDVGKPLDYQLEDFHSTRPGHDAHYGLNPAKLEAAGWTMPIPFRDSLRKTVQWTLKHPEWLASE
jgi:dTDP-glucose 4,6-dehydratase